MQWKKIKGGFATAKVESGEPLDVAMREIWKQVKDEIFMPDDVQR